MFSIVRKIITLILTEVCNLDCVYCFEHNKSVHAMSFDTAKQIIDSEFGDLYNCSCDFEIDFFGGEPLLEFSLICSVYEYVERIKGDLNVIYSMTTNGTLMHGAIQKWFFDRKHNFFCSLSLDGDKEMHNTNRCNSFEDIDIPFFIETWPDVSVKMTVSPYTIHSLARGVLFAHSYGFRVNANLAYGVDWDDERNRESLQRELKILIDYYLLHPEIEPCAMLNLNIQYARTGIKKVPKWCGFGSHMKAFDYSGESYYCHTFAPISISKKKTNAGNRVIIQDEYDIRNYDEKCQHCVAVACCPCCYGTSYSDYGNIFRKDDGLCKMMKLVLLANSYFRYQQLKSQCIKTSTEEGLAILNGVMHIQKNLK